jgi:hypothetical protein
MKVLFTVDKLHKLANNSKHIKWYAIGLVIERFDVLVRLIVQKTK